MGKILDFIFGKSPAIFDKDGVVRHRHPDKKWNDWNNRYQQGSEYNWRNHTGVRGSDFRSDQRPETKKRPH